MSCRPQTGLACTGGKDRFAMLCCPTCEEIYEVQVLTGTTDRMTEGWLGVPPTYSMSVTSDRDVEIALFLTEMVKDSIRVGPKTETSDIDILRLQQYSSSPPLTDRAAVYIHRYTQGKQTREKP